MIIKAVRREYEKLRAYIYIYTCIVSSQYEQKERVLMKSREPLKFSMSLFCRAQSMPLCNYLDSRKGSLCFFHGVREGSIPPQWNDGLSEFRVRGFPRQKLKKNESLIEIKESWGRSGKKATMSLIRVYAYACVCVTMHMINTS